MKMKTRRALLALTALFPALTACDSGNDPSQIPPPMLAEATFEGLGDLSGGDFYSFARAISADGSTVVGSSSSASGTEAFRWTTNDGMMGLGDLPGGRFHSLASDVSSDGSVIVGNSVSDTRSEAFLWENDTMTPLGRLTGCAYSAAATVSADGSVVAGNSQIGCDTEAFRWANDEMIGLGDLSGGDFQSFANAASADGSVVVGSGATSNGGSKAFKWANGVMVALEDLDSVASGISPDGTIIVGYAFTQNGYEASYWVIGTRTGLGDLPGADFDSQAYSVSADGAVAVGYGSTVNGEEAFIWTEDDGMQNLKAALESNFGLDLTGWMLEEAYDISADGTVIVGRGTNPNGDTEAWRAFLGAPVGG